MATFKMILPFQLEAYGFRGPKVLLPLPPSSSAHPAWSLGHWPRAELAFPRTRGPQKHFSFVPRVYTLLQMPNTHVCHCLFFPTVEGEGVRETWQSSKEPRPLFIPVDSQLEGISGREERAGLEDKLPHPPISQRLLFSYPSLDFSSPTLA